MQTRTSQAILRRDGARTSQITRHFATLLLTTAFLLLLGLASKPARASYDTVHDFPVAPGDGSGPIGAMVEDPGTGNYYGTTKFGGQFGQGSVFCMNAASYVVNVIHSFSGKDGANPTGTLILVPALSAVAAPATLYGTTLNGGKYNLGTVFKIATTGASFTTLYNFHGGADGANPFAGVIQAADHLLYGTTLRGGRYNLGTVYRINAGGTDTILHHFSGTSVPGLIDGAIPYARLLEIDGDGDFVGTTASGGFDNNGVVFRIGLTGAPYGLLHLFNGMSDGSHPMSELIQVFAVDLNRPMLYGTTFNGGVAPTGKPLNQGTVYRIHESGALYGLIYSFGTDGSNDGSNPFGALVAVPNVSGPLLYGATRNGGDFGIGTVYMVLPVPSPAAILHSFSGLLGPIDDGANPYSALIESKVDGLLYGTSNTEGASGDGTLYEISP